MSSPIVLNTSAQLNGVGLVLAAPRVTLTNADIIALPTTPFQLMAAPGANIRTRLISATIYLDVSTATYTNVNTTYAALAITTTDAATGFWQGGGPMNNGALATPLTALTGMFGGATHDSVVDFLCPAPNVLDSGAQSGVYVYNLPYVPGTSATYNKPYYLSMDNNGSGVLTGGNAANRAFVWLYYTQETIV